jgi:aspartate kinase
MLEMAASGARVLQLRSVEFARNHGVKLHVRSTFTDEPGTWVAEEDERMLEKAMISGVTHTLEEAVYRVEGPALAELFTALADASVNVDTIIQTAEETIFSAPTEDTPAAAAVLDRLGARWSRDDDLGKVSIVGAGMKSHPGIAARTFSTLAGLGVSPQYVSTSPIKIAFYVPQGDVERTVRALHDAFELSSADAERQHA